MTPKSEALAFRIWQAAQPIGWNVTIAEMAEIIGEPMPPVRAVCIKKRWLSRFRTADKDVYRHRNGDSVGFVPNRTRLNDLADIVGRQ